MTLSEADLGTADALHTHVETAGYWVEDKRAHDRVTVKDNQPPPASRHRRPPDGGLSPLEYVTVEKAHGRVETRRIWTSGTLHASVAFPDTAQVACVERAIVHVSRGTTTLDRVYLLSSQGRAAASPAPRLALNRGHGGIENRLHHVRDMAFDEDRGRAARAIRPVGWPVYAISRPACCAYSPSPTSRPRCVT